MNADDRAKADATVAICKCGNVVISVVTAFIDEACKAELFDAVVSGCDLSDTLRCG